MAKYFIDFSDLPLGLEPAGITRQWYPDSTEQEIVAGNPIESSDQRLAYRITGPNFQRTGISFDEVPAAGNISVVARMRESWASGAAIAGPLICGSGTGPSRTGYCVWVRTNNNLSLVRYSGGSDTTVASISSSAAKEIIPDGVEDVTVELEKIGSLVRAYVWATVNPRPTTPTLEYTDPNPLADGFAGVSNVSSNNRVLDVYYIGATDDPENESPPTEPVEDPTKEGLNFEFEGGPTTGVYVDSDLEFSGQTIDYEFEGGPSAGVYVDSQFEFGESPAPQLDYLLVIGASIMHEVFYLDNTGTGEDTDSAASMRHSFVNAGVEMPWQMDAVRGARMSDTLSTLANSLALFNGVPNVGVLVHASGNDCSDNGAYSGWTQQQKDDFVNELNQICDMILAEGHELILPSITYRVQPYAVSDPDEGTKLVNEELVYPIIQAKSPNWWDGEAGRPVLDFWQHVYDRRAYWFHESNQVHPSVQGKWETQDYIAQTLADNASLPPAEPGETFNFSVNAHHGRETWAPGSNRISGNGTLTGLTNSAGKLLESATVTQSDFSGTPGNANGLSDPLNLRADSLYWGTTRNQVFVTSQTGVTTIDFGPEYANRQIIARITGTRDDTPSDRSSVYRVNGVDGGPLDARLQPPGQVEIEAETDANGVVVLEVERELDSGAGYLSGWDIVFPESGLNYEFEGGPTVGVYVDSDFEYSATTLDYEFEGSIQTGVYVDSEFEFTSATLDYEFDGYIASGVYVDSEVDFSALLNYEFEGAIYVGTYLDSEFEFSIEPGEQEHVPSEFYARMAATAARLIDRFGAPVVLVRKSGGQSDPITGEVTPSVDNSKLTTGILKRFPDRLIDGTRIMSGDRTLILDSKVEPLMTDRPRIGGQEWVPVSIETVDPAGLPLVYFVHCRR